MTAVKIYYASPFFEAGNKIKTKQVAEAIREHFGTKVEVYLPQENEAINDKANVTNFVTDIQIAKGDNYYLDRCDILLADMDGIGVDPGVATEIGYIGGQNKYIAKHSKRLQALDNRFTRPKHIIGFNTDIRLNKTPQEVLDTIKESEDKVGIEIIENLKDNNLYRNLYTRGVVAKNGVYIASQDYYIDEIIKAIEEYIVALPEANG